MSGDTAQVGQDFVISNLLPCINCAWDFGVEAGQQIVTNAQLKVSDTYGGSLLEPSVELSI